MMTLQSKTTERFSRKWGAYPCRVLPSASYVYSVERGLPGRSSRDSSARSEIFRGPQCMRTRCGLEGRAPLSGYSASRLARRMARHARTRALPVSNRDEQRSGFVLVAVLVLVMLVSMVAVSLMFHLRAEETAAAAGIGSEQAWSAAMSGVHEAMRVALSIPPGSLDWQDSPEIFRDRFVFDDGSDRWYFSIFSGGDSERQTVRSGLTDEASKLHLTNVTEVMLSKFPGITPYIAQGLLDFQDADNTPRPEGAEQEYYDTLAKPYSVFNRPVSTIGELLLVRGITPAVLYGEDANQNYQLDANEDDGDTQFPPDNKDGKLDYGLSESFTVSSYDLNRASDGTPRINVNVPEEAVPETDVPAALVRYIAALRRSNVKINQPADLLEAKAKLKDEKGQEIELSSGVGKAELAAVLDRFTTKPDRQFPGLININTASARVLQTLDGIDEALAEAIVAARRNLHPEQRRTPAWLYEEGLVNADVFRKLVPSLTARSYQFHFQVIGFAVPSGRYRVLEAIIDVAGSTPVISYLRDITRLGLPFRIDAIAEPGEFGSLRAPQGTDRNLRYSAARGSRNQSRTWIFESRKNTPQKASRLVSILAETTRLQICATQSRSSVSRRKEQHHG